jgi:hypothetical protein
MQFLWAVLAVLAFGILPCTSGPLLVGYFYGWYWAVLGIFVLWGAFALHNGMVSWPNRGKKKEKAGNTDVS